jgi:hypothetical protein
MLKLTPTPIGQSMIARCNPSHSPEPRFEAPVTTSKVKEKRVEYIDQQGDHIKTVREVYLYDTDEPAVDHNAVFEEIMRRLDNHHSKPAPYVRNSAGYIVMKMSEMERLRRSYDRLFKDQNQKLQTLESTATDLRKTVEQLTAKHKKLSKKQKASKSKTVIVESTPPAPPKPDNVVELKLAETRDAVAQAVPYLRALTTMALANQSTRANRR